VAAPEEVVGVSAPEKVLAHRVDTLDHVEETGAAEGSARSARDILEEWRAAERALTEARPGSAEAMGGFVRARELRAEYQRAVRDAQRE
jgi:hypothetical protein